MCAAPDGEERTVDTVRFYVVSDVACVSFAASGTSDPSSSWFGGEAV